MKSFYNYTITILLSNVLFIYYFRCLDFCTHNLLICKGIKTILIKIHAHAHTNIEYLLTKSYQIYCTKKLQYNLNVV